MLDCLRRPASCGKGIGKDPVVGGLTGDGLLDEVFKFSGKRGACSKKLPGCSELLFCCDKLDEPLEVFRRSWFWPALKDTSRGDEG